IIAGVVLSTLHQSSLGTLMLITASKVHPLWYSPISPLLFLLSAIAVGFPMVIVESLLASRSFKLAPEMPVLSRLARFIPALLGIYLGFKIGDIVIRETFVYLTEFNFVTFMFTLEVVGGVIIPLRMLMSPTVRNSPPLLFTAALLVVLGVLLTRINTFITAYNPPYDVHPYFPSFGEISVTVGFVALLMLAYRYMALNFPILGSEEGAPARRAKYSLRRAGS
ncbi:MAG: Ni/Fe-hydrogenase 2 integral rane subunit HybB, partial [Bacteroidetes bacterium]|nr:Ni/Fe-hydrogenase 2 integral rane subunit HybB [Bacteroidota bacterium]